MGPVYHLGSEPLGWPRVVPPDFVAARDCPSVSAAELANSMAERGSAVGMVERREPWAPWAPLLAR